MLWSHSFIDFTLQEHEPEEPETEKDEEEGEGGKVFLPCLYSVLFLGIIYNYLQQQSHSFDFVFNL